MRSFLSIILILFAAVSANSIVLSPAQQQVDLREKGQTVPHTQWNIPADMPDVYYDSELDVITIVDYANVTYYVTIYDDWWNAVITDTKPGGGTISASSLSSGDYVIEITTSWKNPESVIRPTDNIDETVCSSHNSISVGILLPLPSHRSPLRHHRQCCNLLDINPVLT